MKKKRQNLLMVLMPTLAELMVSNRLFITGRVPEFGGDDWISRLQTGIAWDTDVTASEVFLTLMKLHRKNLVSAYLFDPTTQAYSLTSTPEDQEMTNLWWFENKNALRREDGICTCPCHDKPHAVMHPVECCEKCPQCKKGIARGMMEVHLQVCTGRKRK